MKLGIVTFHNIPNIGAVLQAYSLCQAFRQIGADCDIIDYTCDNIRKRELTPPHTGNVIKDIILRIILWPRLRKKIKACQDFMRNNKCYSSRVYTKQTLIEANKMYDVFVSGSDMIWNLGVTDYDWTYFLDFVDEENKRVAYGSSIGDKWKPEDVDKVRGYLSKYSNIAVRESDTCANLNELGIQSQLVCDPTMLMSVDHWKSLAIKPKETAYVLVYFPSKINIECAQEYASKHNLSVLVMNWGLPSRKYNEVSPISPAEWIGYFLHADAIFTGSFHGLLFSLYFEKPVWTDNKSNRVSSILKEFGIQESFIDNSLYNDIQIDYNCVNKLIEKFRKNSISYLYGIIQ